MIKVAIADDHAIVRQGLKQLLLMQDNMAVVGEAANHVEVMHTLRHQEVDTLLLDIAMPGRNGIDILKQLRPEFPKLPVLILSMYPENQYAIRALKAGASGYLTKMAAADQLVEAIRQITAGRKYITAELA
ncbi:MAG: response regulator, partial [Burkholderiales bacterium]